MIGGLISWLAGCLRFGCHKHTHRQAKLTSARVAELEGGPQQQLEGEGKGEGETDAASSYLAPGAFVYVHMLLPCASAADLTDSHCIAHPTPTHRVLGDGVFVVVCCHDPGRRCVRAGRGVVGRLGAAAALCGPTPLAGGAAGGRGREVRRKALTYLLTQRKGQGVHGRPQITHWFPLNMTSSKQQGPPPHLRRRLGGLGGVRPSIHTPTAARAALRLRGAAHRDVGAGARGPPQRGARHGAPPGAAGGNGVKEGV